MFPGCQVQGGAAVLVRRGRRDARVTRAGSAPGADPRRGAEGGGLRRRVEAHRAGQSRGVRPRRVKRIKRIGRRIIRRSSRRRGAAGGGRAGRLEGTERHGAIGAPVTVRSRVSERDFDTRGAQVRPATFRAFGVLARARRGRGPTSLAADAVGRRIGARAVAPAPRARRSAILRRRDESRRHSTGRRREGFASGFAGRFGVRLERPGVAEDARGCRGGGD